MSTQWMDDFQGYGTDANRVTRMSDGPYAETAWCELKVDPDPTAGGKYVLYLDSNNATSFRKVLTGPQAIVGVAARYWVGSLPSNTGEQPWFSGVSDTNNNIHCYVICDPSGYIQIYRRDSTGDVNIGSSSGPVIITNSWHHLEVKYVLNATTGSVEVRQEGVTVAIVNGIRTTSNVSGALATAQNVCYHHGHSSSGGFPDLYIKDFIIWDGNGTINNNFFGSCQVYRITPNADVSRNWNTTLGAAPLQNPASTSTTGGTLAANTYYYVVTAILNPQGESIASNEVSITTTGTTSSNTITWTAPPGMTVTGYRVYRGTAAGAENVYYAPGNVLTFTDTGGASTAGTPPTDTGTGFSQINEVTPDDDATFITAGQGPYPAAYQATMTQLPTNVTTVRSVMTIHRSRKTDGGDGNIQASLISGANTGSGTSRPITTAYTYWWDVFENDPSGSNWNKTLVNALKLKLDRTL